MPLKGILCKQTGEKTDFDKCLECKERACLPYPYRFLIYSHNNNQSIDFRVTDLLSCPLRKWLYNNNDVYLDYESLHYTAIRGSLVHSALEQEPNDSKITKERRFFRLIQGIKISGQLDRIETTGIVFDGKKEVTACTIEDYKTTKTIIPSKIPKKEHVAQANIYAWLLRGNGYKPEKILIHYIDFGDCISVEAPLIGNAEIEAYINERLDIFKPVILENKEPKGEPSFLCNLQNRTKKSYCAVRSICPVWNSCGRVGD